MEVIVMNTEAEEVDGGRERFEWDSGRQIIKSQPVSCPDPSTKPPTNPSTSQPQSTSSTPNQHWRHHLHFLLCSAAPPIIHPKPSHHPWFRLPSFLHHRHHDQHRFPECELTGASYWAKRFVFSHLIFIKPLWNRPLICILPKKETTAQKS